MVGASALPRAESESLTPLKKPMPCWSASRPLRMIVDVVNEVAPAIVRTSANATATSAARGRWSRIAVRADGVER